MSIGTGLPPLTAFGDSLVKNEVGEALVAIATNTEVVADEFERLYPMLFCNHHAFRFNVVQGLENVGLEEASKVPVIEGATRRYIQQEKTFNSLKACAQRLKERECMSQYN